MKILWMAALGLTGCITTYKRDQNDQPTSEVSESTLKFKDASIAIFPVEYKGPGHVVRNREFLRNMQKNIGSQISNKGFDRIILLNEINNQDVKADYYLKVAFSEDNNSDVAGLLFGITFGIIPIILPFSTPYTNTAEIQIFDSSRNSLHFQTVKREGTTIWHAALIPVGLAWDHNTREDEIRDDVVEDISNVTNTKLEQALNDI